MSVDCKSIPAFFHAWCSSYSPVWWQQKKVSKELVRCEISWNSCSPLGSKLQFTRGKAEALSFPTLPTLSCEVLKHQLKHLALQKTCWQGQDLQQPGCRQWTELLICTLAMCISSFTPPACSCSPGPGVQLRTVCLTASVGSHTFSLLCLTNFPALEHDLAAL